MLLFFTVNARSIETLGILRLLWHKTKNGGVLGNDYLTKKMDFKQKTSAVDKIRKNYLLKWNLFKYVSVLKKF